VGKGHYTIVYFAWGWFPLTQNILLAKIGKGTGARGYALAQKPLDAILKQLTANFTK
jgi:hypothetical protein